MKPATIGQVMRISANRLNRLPVISLKRFLQSLVRVAIPTSDAREDSDFRDKRGRESFRLASHLENPALSTAISVVNECERHNQSSMGSQRIEPYRMKMRGASVNKNCIGRAGVDLSTIAFYHLHVGEVAEIIASTTSELCINLYRSDMPFSAYNLSDDRCVVAGATTDVDYMIDRLYLQPVDQRSQKTRVTVVKLTIWVDCHKYIVVETFRICVLRCPVALEPRTPNVPRSGPKEMLSWNFRECSYHRF